MRTVKKVYENNKLVYTYTYIWDGDVLLGGRMKVTDADEPITIRYLYDDSGELYGMDYNGNGYFAFIKNLQGDIVSIVPLDSESNVEINMEYDAWGKPIIQQGSSLAEGLLMAMLMAVTNVGYRGYFYDFETGLYYLRSRYYDPEIGRFINADDTAYLGYNGSPLSMNLFVYCLNNPVNYMDKDGNLTATITVAILIGIMVTAYVGIAILASGSLVFPSVFNTDWSKMGSALYQLSANMINKKVAIISLVYNSLKIWFKGLTESIAKSFAKCKTKPRYRTPTEVHHIIAQKADAAKEARNIFCGKLRHSINDKANLISIKTGLHRRLHTSNYYNIVNYYVKSAYNKGFSKSEKNQYVLLTLAAIAMVLRNMEKAAPF